MINIKKICGICSKAFEVPPHRESTAKYCSRTCSDIGLQRPANAKCSQCGVNFRMKASRQLKYPRTLGFFCSKECLGQYKKIGYFGEKNPNYRGRETDYDGYPLQTIVTPGGYPCKIKIHKFVALTTLKLKKIGKGFHIHHRDCDVNNSAPDNLVVLTVSDHKWLHKQFGNATLWAYMRELIDLDTLATWSKEPDRVKRLLPLNLLNQDILKIGVVKDGELLETPVAGNQQPSKGRNLLEGSETSDRSLPRKSKEVMSPRAPSTER